MVRNPPANVGDARDTGSIPGSGRPPGLEKKWQPTPVFLPGIFHGQRSLEGTIHRVTRDTIHGATKSCRHGEAGRLALLLLHVINVTCPRNLKNKN